MPAAIGRPGPPVRAEAGVVGCGVPGRVEAVHQGANDALQDSILLLLEVVSEKVLDDCLARRASARVGRALIRAGLDAPCRVHRPRAPIVIPVPLRDRQDPVRVHGPVVHGVVWAHEDTVQHLVHDVALRAEKYGEHRAVVVVFQRGQGPHHQIIGLRVLHLHHLVDAQPSRKDNPVHPGDRDRIGGLGRPEIGGELAVGVWKVVQARPEHRSLRRRQGRAVGRPREDLARVYKLGVGGGALDVPPVYYRVLAQEGQVGLQASCPCGRVCQAQPHIAHHRRGGGNIRVGLILDGRVEQGLVEEDMGRLVPLSLHVVVPACAEDAQDGDPLPLEHRGGGEEGAAVGAA